MRFEKRKIENISGKWLSEICDTYQISSDVATLLFSRGYDTKEKVLKFLKPSVTDFHNPFLFPDMQKVVDKINEHKNKRSKFLIVGDYDADGVCASAILYKHFKSLGINVECFLPNRFDDGYGLTIPTVDKIVELYSPDLIITVDCGISCYNEVEYIKSKGIDIIVTDHHELPEQIPNCLIIDPKQGESYPFSGLCGAGVAFKVVHALSGLSIAYNYVAIASIATVADIVPLEDENRAIVYYGLQVFDEQIPSGVKMLVKELDIGHVTSHDIAMKIAPRINTAGRMADASIGFSLFVEDNDEKAKAVLEELTLLNEKRVSAVNDILNDIEEYCKTENMGNKHIMVFKSDNWEAGVLGIACARLVEKYNRPVVCMTLVGEEYRGSVRSIPKIDIFTVLSAVKDDLIRYGGHSQAGGLSVSKENYQKFVYDIEEYVSNNYTSQDFVQVKQYDIDITKYELNEKFLTQFEVLEPTGYCNEKPVFMLDMSLCKFSLMKNHDHHLKTMFNDVEIVGFNFGHLYPLLSSNCKKYAILELNMNEFRGVRKLKGNIRAVTTENILSPISKDIENGNIVKNMSPYAHNTLQFIDNDEVYESLKFDLEDSAFGTMIVAHTFIAMKSFIAKYEIGEVEYSLYKCNQESGKNTLILSPMDESVYKNYDNIYFIDNGFSKNIEGKNVQQFSGFTSYKVFDELSTDRQEFVMYHTGIRNMINKNVQVDNDFDFYLCMKKLCPEYKNMNYSMFCFALRVFTELDFFRVNSDKFEVTLGQGKQPLTNSVLYNFILNLKKGI